MLSPTVGHWDCFWLVVTNTAGIKACVQVFAQVYILFIFYKYIVGVCLDPILIYLSLFKQIAKLFFSKVVVSFDSALQFIDATVAPHPCQQHDFNFSFSNWFIMKFHYGLNLHFLFSKFLKLRTCSCGILLSKCFLWFCSNAFQFLKFFFPPLRNAIYVNINANTYICLQNFVYFTYIYLKAYHMVQ